MKCNYCPNQDIEERQMENMTAGGNRYIFCQILAECTICNVYYHCSSDREVRYITFRSQYIGEKEYVIRLLLREQRTEIWYRDWNGQNPEITSLVCVLSHVINWVPTNIISKLKLYLPFI